MVVSLAFSLVRIKLVHGLLAKIGFDFGQFTKLELLLLIQFVDRDDSLGYISDAVPDVIDRDFRYMAGIDSLKPISFELESGMRP